MTHSYFDVTYLVNLAQHLLLHWRTFTLCALQLWTWWGFFFISTWRVFFSFRRNAFFFQTWRVFCFHSEVTRFFFIPTWRGVFFYSEVRRVFFSCRHDAVFFSFRRDAVLFFIPTWRGLFSFRHDAFCFHFDVTLFQRQKTKYATLFGRRTFYSV